MIIKGGERSREEEDVNPKDKEAKSRTGVVDKQRSPLEGGRG